MMPCGFANSAAVARRPQFHLEDDALYFLASQRPYCRLTPAEAVVWRSLAEPAAVDRITATLGAEAGDAAHALRRRGVCEFLEDTFPAGRRRVLVIEPHADDAVLSVGGSLWQRRHECEFTLATLASRSNFTSYYYAPREFYRVEPVTELRRAESRLVARMIGGQHVEAGLSDAVMRYRDGDWSLEFYRAHRHAISAVTARRGAARELDAWRRAVRELLEGSDAEEIWIPQGSPHADHQLAADACLEALVQERWSARARPVKIYRDVPYAARNPGYSHARSSALARAGFALEEEQVDVSGVFAEKLRLVSIYGSQFKLEAMRADIEASAASMGDPLKRVEILWSMSGAPQAFDALAPEWMANDARAGAEASARWLARHAHAASVRILLVTPTGCWRSDLALLSGVLPEAHFEVHAGEGALAEVQSAASPRVSVRPVGAGATAWGAEALGLTLRTPMPTLFHSGPRRWSLARRLRRLWPLADTLVVDSMDAVVAGAALLTGVRA